MPPPSSPAGVRSVAVVLAASVVIALFAVMASRLGLPTAGTLVILVGGLVGLAARRLTQVQVLVIGVVLLLLIPARYRFEPLGALGTPAALLGLAGIGIWSGGVLLQRPWLASRRHPIRWAILGVLVSVLLSYVALGFRPHDEVEARASDRGLLTMLSAIGIALLAADLIQRRSALIRVVQTIVAAGAVVAAAGVLQFITAIDLASVVQLPGFTFVAPFVLSLLIKGVQYRLVSDAYRVDVTDREVEVKLDELLSAEGVEALDALYARLAAENQGRVVPGSDGSVVQILEDSGVGSASGP